MIQNHRFSTGLKEYIPNISYKDTNAVSDNYFRISNFPDKLLAGKTSFRIKPNLDSLVQGSTIYIDVIDSNGNPIYHEVANFLGNDKSRLIVIYVYENTPPGEATLYIGGRLKYDIKNNKYISWNNDIDSWDYLHRPNLIWEKKLTVIPNKVNDDEIIFIQDPEVSCHERAEYFSTAPISERKKIISPQTASLSLKSVNPPLQYSNTSRFTTNAIEFGNTISLDPSSSNNSEFIKSDSVKLPVYSEYNVISAIGMNFTSDMVGGSILVNPTSSPAYSGSIIKVLDKNTIQVSSPYITGQTDKFINESNVTMSFITRDVTLISYETESFVQIDLNNIEPIAGNVDAVRVSYKPYGTFGEFISIGEFPLKEQNYLINSSSLIADKTTIIEQPIGDLDNYNEYNDYWSIQSPLDYYIFSQPQYFERGCSLYYSSSTQITSSHHDYLMLFKLKSDYFVNSKENTEYKLEISSKYSDQIFTNINNDYNDQQIDIFISGSPVISDDVHLHSIQDLLQTREFGTYIGSINTKYSKTQLNSKFYFKTIETGPITPVFVIRSGTGWEIKEIKLSPRNEIGYSPNQAKLLVPINSLKTNIELVLQLEYLNVLGIKADRNTILYGLNFKGSGFPKDRLLKGTDIVSSSGQFKNLLDQFTSSLFPSGGGYDVHIQSTPSSTWSFDHGLNNRRPVITVYNSNDEVIIPEKIFGSSSNTTYIYFPFPMTGYASATVGSKLPTGSVDWNDIINKPNHLNYNVINHLYGVMESINQTPDATGSLIVRFKPIVSSNSNLVSGLISGTFFKPLDTGSYLIESSFKINNPPPIFKVSILQDYNSSGEFVESTLMSSSIGYNNIVNITGVYSSTGSNNSVALKVVGSSSYTIPSQSVETPGFIKIQKISN